MGAIPVYLWAPVGHARPGAIVRGIDCSDHPLQGGRIWMYEMIDEEDND